MPRGGRRSTTWSPTWNLGKTTTIRIPIAISQELLQIARKIDDGNLDPNSLLQGEIDTSNALLQDKINRAIEFLKQGLQINGNAGRAIKMRIYWAIAVLKDKPKTVQDKPGQN